MVLSGLHDSKSASHIFHFLRDADSNAQHPPQKSPPSFLSPVINVLNTSIPTEYQLPDEIRTFFKDGETHRSFTRPPTNLIGHAIVATGNNGTYVDSSEAKPPRLKSVLLRIAL